MDSDTGRDAGVDVGTYGGGDSGADQIFDKKTYSREKTDICIICITMYLVLPFFITRLVLTVEDIFQKWVNEFFHFSFFWNISTTLLLMALNMPICP